MRKEVGGGEGVGFESSVHRIWSVHAISMLECGEITDVRLPGLRAERNGSQVFLVTKWPDKLARGEEVEHR